LVYLGVSWLGR